MSEHNEKTACKTCEEIEKEQNECMREKCEKKFHLLPRVNCCNPEGEIPREEDYHERGDGEHPRKDDCCCEGECTTVCFPEIKPCISVKWGDSKCDCFETDDLEVLCITVCNCYCNVTFRDFSINHIKITDMAGKPVPCLPNGTPSVDIIPSGPICFGDIGPCNCECNKPTCVSREFAISTCGAIGQCYLLSFEGICFTVCHEEQSKECFVVKLCPD